MGGRGVWNDRVADWVGGQGVVGETIHLSDIPRLMELLGVGMTQAEVLQAQFSLIDYDKSGDIDFEDEFLRVMSRKPSSQHSAEDAAWAFRMLVRNATGDSRTILREDIHHGLLTYLEPPLSELRIEDLLDHAEASLEDASEAAEPAAPAVVRRPAKDNKAIDFQAIIDVMNATS